MDRAYRGRPCPGGGRDSPGSQADLVAPASACGPACVLVHGAFADASGFRGLHDELLGEDVTVVAPPNPLRGLSGGDGAYIKAAVDEIGGPVLLAGHFYGGSVITAAGTADNVVGLVYISGFAPDEGENLTDLQSNTTRAGGGHPRSASRLLPLNFLVIWRRG